MDLSAYLTLAAIVFTIGIAGIILNHKNIIKRQDIGAQNARNPKTAVELRKVPSRAGI
jgi:NADH-quinone oxidoreductase subunit J